jgi:GH25 family lysozyme M1 (1,4-beta-N-acetylmuramidase)
MNYVLGADVSKYQNAPSTPQRPDFQKLKDGGCKFVIIRASQNVSIDPDFVYNWDAAKKVGLLRGAYHFYEYRSGIGKPILEQAKFFDSVLGKDPGEIPPAVDYECPNQTWPPLPDRATGLANLEIWFNYMDAKHKKGVFYSNPNTILYNLRPRSDSGGFLLMHPLWIAQYYYKLLNGQIAQPVQHCSTPEELGARQPYHGNWVDWIFWQYGTPSIGIQMGMESKEIDMDVYNGSEQDLLAFCGITVKPLTIEERVARLEKHCGI